MTTKKFFSGIKTRPAAAILIFVLMTAPASAEMYSWVDDQGTQHYTANFESIPEAYRPAARMLSLLGSPSPPPEMPAAPAPKGTTTIRFSHGSPVLVSARINGAGPVTLMLDTGADRTLVKVSALRKLGIWNENTVRMALKGVTGEANAEAFWVNAVEVQDAKVGPLLIVAHDADLMGAEGLLGRDFLSHFNVSIDSKEGLVTLKAH